MTDIKVSISAYLPDIEGILEKIDATRSFPNVLQALDEIANLYHEAWISFASGTPIPPSGRRINSRGTYKESIKKDLSNRTTKVVFSDSIIHKYLEEGSPAVDLKPGLLKGPKVKYGKHGPYTVVAFRHDVPSSSARNPMPINIFNIVKSIRRQPFPKGEKTRQVISQKDQTGRRSKLTSKYGIEGVKSNYTWKVGKYAGMQQRDISTASAKRSSYITFRTVSIRSDPSSWIRPPQEGIPIRQATIDIVRDIAEDILKDALEKDLS